MTRHDQRQGFLISTVVHMVILTALWSHPPSMTRARRPVPPAEPARVTQRVFLPPPALLRQYLPDPPPAARPRPQATPPPAEPKAKDRISIGPPSEERSKGPLLLRREDDLTAVPKGRPDAAPSPRTPAQVAPPTPAAQGASPAASGRPGPRLPSDPAGKTGAGDDGAVPRPGASTPSIASSLRNLDRRLQAEGPRGLPAGTTVQQIGPFSFDPQGADFTLWLNHFKNEIYRNWIVPQPALFGMRGHVDLEFTVERDGTLTGLRMLKASGTPALDRAAQNALLGSRALPLPADYAPQRLQMQVVFFYNEGPQGS